MRHLLKALVPFAAMAAVMAVVASPANATITITPASTAFTATLTGFATFTAGSFTVSCTGSTAAGTTAASGPSVSFPAPTFTGCTTSGGNSASVVVTSATSTCAWTLTIKSADATGSSGMATAPGGKQADGTVCMSIEVTVMGVPVCTITVSTSTIAVTYVNATTSLKTDNPNTIAFVSSGGLCGLSGTATYKAQYSITPNTFQATST